MEELVEKPKLAYMDMIDFIARGSTPSEVANFRPSDEAQRRVSELLGKNSAGEIAEAELSELDHYLELEHIMRMAKVRARQLLAEAG